MEAVFFVSAPESAVGVTCVDDLPGDPAGEALAVGSPAVLTALVELLEGGLLQPVRDATCRSFPVELGRAIAGLDTAGLDALADRWHARAARELGDAHPYDLSLCLGEIRDALLASAPGEQLFVLLEEKAW